MMERLSKNFVWMAAANGAASILGAAIFIYLARVLMPGALGTFSYALTVIFFLYNFVDLGLSTYGMREIARAPERLYGYVSEIVSLRIMLAAVLSVGLILFVCVSTHSGTLRILLVESLIILFAMALATEWAFQGIERMQMVFFSLTTTAVLQLAAMVILVRGPGDLVRVPLIYGCAVLPIVAVFLVRLRFRFRFTVDDRRRIRMYLASSLIIWLISICAQIYNSLDILLLGFFRTVDEVGYFTVARRLIGGMTLMAIFLANAVFPRLASSFGRDRASFREATRHFLRLAGAIAGCVLLPLLILADRVILLAFGEAYLPAVLPFRIMVVGLGCILFNLPFSTGLIASGMERAVLGQTAASAFLSVILNVVLLPKYGMIGASLSFVCAETLALAWILTVYRKKIGTGVPA